MAVSRGGSTYWAAQLPLIPCHSPPSPRLHHLTWGHASRCTAAVYEGLRNGKDGLPDQYARQLTPEQKKRRVVLKKVNMDNSGIRTNFLAVGERSAGRAGGGRGETRLRALLPGQRG